MVRTLEAYTVRDCTSRALGTLHGTRLSKYRLVRLLPSLQLVGQRVQVVPDMAAEIQQEL